MIKIYNMKIISLLFCLSFLTNMYISQRQGIYGNPSRGSNSIKSSGKSNSKLSGEIPSKIKSKLQNILSKQGKIAPPSSGALNSFNGSSSPEDLSTFPSNQGNFGRKRGYGGNGSVSNLSHSNFNFPIPFYRIKYTPCDCYLNDEPWDCYEITFWNQVNIVYRMINTLGRGHDCMFKRDLAENIFTFILNSCSQILQNAYVDWFSNVSSSWC